MIIVSTNEGGKMHHHSLTRSICLTQLQSTDICFSYPYIIFLHLGTCHRA